MLYRLLAVFVILLPSCKNNDPVMEEELAEYTVMYYRSSGLGLDFHHKEILEELQSVGSTEKVNVVAEFKYSKDFQNDPDFCEGTQRGVIEKDNIRIIQSKDADYPMHKPENIAEFITWAKTNFPAKKYIFVSSGHGSGWTAEHDTPTSKALNPDDNIEGIPYISIVDLAEGFRLSETNFEMIFFHNCLMLTAEVIGEIQPYTHYMLGSAHEMWLPGTSFAYFLRQLNKPMDLTESMKPFISQTIYNWSLAHPQQNLDMQLLDLTKSDPMFNTIKNIVSRLKVLAEDEDHRDMLSIATEKTYRFDKTWPLFDLGDYINALIYSKYPCDTKLLILYSEFDEALRDMLVYKDEKNSEDKKVSISINIVNTTRYTQEYLAGKQPYNTLRFHKITGWGEWLSLIKDFS